MEFGIKRLDHGYIGLVNSMGDDLSVVRSARVSHAAQWRTGEDAGKDEKLIRYLMAHRHTTPFESVVLTFEVKAPIFVYRQWHRHRTQSYNEVSARYTELPEEFYIPEAENIGIQDPKTKQARDRTAQLGIADQYRRYLRIHCENGFREYKKALNAGVPRELARLFLSVNTYSTMSATMNLHNLFHFLGLRLDKHAQYEIRVYAQAILELIRPVVPISVDAWIQTYGSELELE